MHRPRVLGLAAPVLALVIAAACGGGGNSGAHGDDGGPADGSGSSSGGGSGGSSGGGSGGSSGGGSGGSSSGGGSGSGSSSGGKDGGGPPVGASVLHMHNHVNRDGFYVDKGVTAATAPKFALTSFSAPVNGTVYASPLYVESGPKGKGTLYVATESNDVYAFDETTGAQVWHKTVATPVKATGASCNGNIAGSGGMGVTGTPAIDLSTRLMVLSAVTADGNGNIGTHTIYALSIDDGSVKWSVDVTQIKDPTGLSFGTMATAQNQRGAVLIVNGVAYVVYGGHYGDCPTTSHVYYHGWVVGVPLTGKGAKAWATGAAGAGIWGSGGAASDGTSVFVTTGNAEGGNGTWNDSEGVFRFDPGPVFTSKSTNYFAPSNWQSLDGGDVDLSGSGPLVIDPASFTPSKVVVAQGKDGNLYLLDRTDLGGVGTALGTLHVSGGEISNAGAWANVGKTTYILVRPNGTENGAGCPGGTSGDLVAVKLDATAAQKMTVAWCASTGGVGSPIVTTSDGTNDALAWTFGAGGSGKLAAFDLATGKSVATGGTSSASGVHRFTSPIVVHGKMYLAGDGKLYQFGG